MPIPISPSRVTITNLATNERIEVQFNPTQLEEEVQANYGRLTVPGLSHQPLQFGNTGNETYALELFWRAMTPRDMETMRQHRRFLKSLLYPRAGAETVAGGAPPRVLFVWPRMLSLSCVVTAVRFTHEQFNRYGQARVSRAAVGLEEIRDVRLTSEEVRDDASLRYGHVPDDDSPAALAYRPTRYEGGT